MATLTPTLTLTSTDAFSHQNISISVRYCLSITAPYSDVSRFDTGDTNDVGGGAGIMHPASGGSDVYFYVRHTGLLASDGVTATTNLVTLQDVANNTMLRLGAGEFAFFPLLANEGLKAVSATADVILEYAYFTKG